MLYNPKRGESAALGRHYNISLKKKNLPARGPQRQRVKNSRPKQAQACCSRLLTPLTPKMLPRVTHRSSSGRGGLLVQQRVGCAAECQVFFNEARRAKRTRYVRKEQDLSPHNLLLHVPSEQRSRFRGRRKKKHASHISCRDNGVKNVRVSNDF